MPGTEDTDNKVPCKLSPENNKCVIPWQIYYKIFQYSEAAEKLDEDPKENSDYRLVYENKITWKYKESESDCPENFLPWPGYVEGDEDEFYIDDPILNDESEEQLEQSAAEEQAETVQLINSAPEIIDLIDLVQVPADVLTTVVLGAIEDFEGDSAYVERFQVSNLDFEDFFNLSIETYDGNIDDGTGAGLNGEYLVLQAVSPPSRLVGNFTSIDFRLTDDNPVVESGRGDYTVTLGVYEEQTTANVSE